MHWSDLSFSPPPQTLRTFSALWLLFLSALAVWTHWVRGNDFPSLLLAAALLFPGLVGMVFPGAIRPLYVGCLVATFPIGWTVSRLVLGMVFFLVFTPLALLFRAVGRDPLRLRRPAGVSSYWTPKSPEGDASSYFRQF